MAGKAIPFLLHEPDPQQWVKLVQGFKKMNLNFEPVRADKEWKVAPGPVCVAAGYEAAVVARETGFRDIHIVPAVDLWIPTQKDYPGLGKLVAEKLKGIARRYESSTTSPSIPTTSIRSTDSNAPNINPREAGLPFPTDKLTMEEIRGLFSDKYSQDEPFIFSSGGAEVAIYPDKPPGKRPIEFSLEEFYTILKLLEITKADGIVWREREDANPK